MIISGNMASENNNGLYYSAYTGTGQYMFVSYAHIDAKIVFPEIGKFQNKGYNVWYDEGIAPGNEWPEEIANALAGCSLFVVFITPNSVESKNVRNEIYYALHHDIPFIAIHLVETELDGGLALSLQSIQAILKYTMSEEEYEFKYTNSFKNNGFLLSDNDNSSKSISKSVNSTINFKKDKGFLDKIKKVFFFWEDNKGNLKFAKTKLVSLIFFIMIFWAAYVPNDPDAFIVAFLVALLFTVPVFIIGFFIHYLNNRHNS